MYLACVINVMYITQTMCTIFYFVLNLQFWLHFATIEMWRLWFWINNDVQCRPKVSGHLIFLYKKLKSILYH